MGVQSPRAVLVDEHPTLRDALRRVLEADGFEVCGEADDAEEGLRTVRETNPDVCLVGLRTESSLEMIAGIADERAGTQTVVVVLTASRSAESMIEAIRAGATGYLLKEMNPERIPAAVRGVLNGEAAMPRTLVVRLIREIQRMGRGPMLRTPEGMVELSARQWEVLSLMSEGLSTTEIAERLAISPVTVRRHRTAIRSRLGVEDGRAAIEILQASL